MPARTEKMLVAIPIYNEARNLHATLPGILQHALPQADVLLLNDGSTDATACILRKYERKSAVHLLTHEQNLGYGQSLIDAFHFAEQRGYTWVITMDCDQQHDPRSLGQFFDLCRAEAADIISGTRYSTYNFRDDAPPPDRAAINRLLTSVINASCGLQLTDSFCGYKAHRVASVQSLGLTEPGYAFPMQFWPRVACAGLSVIELPVRRIYVDPTRSFGQTLDDPDKRLRHYLEILTAELSDCAKPAPLHELVLRSFDARVSCG